MGRHSASYIAAKQGLSAPVTAAGAATYVGRVGLLAVALGIGAAVAGGSGVANADTPTGNRAGQHATQSSSSRSAGDTTGARKSRSHDAPTGTQDADGPAVAPKSTTPSTSSGGSRGASQYRARTGLRTSSHAAESQSKQSVRSSTDTIERTPAAPNTQLTTPSPVLSSTTPPATTTAVLASQTLSEPVRPTPVATAVATFVSARRASPSASGTGGSPTAPATPVLDVLQLVRREIEKAFTLGTPVAAAATTAVAPAVPAPSDQATTPYGAIGKWMLQPNGQISNYGGQLYDGKTLLEPVNVIIVDPKAKNAFQATWRLNIAMRRAGFPSQGIHSSGFKGIINGKTYGQQPSGFLQGYSNAFFLATNDHGRIFGPAPVQTSGGYVWSGTFSTEEWGTYNGRPAHIYVSSNDARAALAAALVASGQATSGDTVALDNEYNTDTTTTGDHDGDAVVLILT